MTPTDDPMPPAESWNTQVGPAPDLGNDKPPFQNPGYSQKDYATAQAGKVQAQQAAQRESTKKKKSWSLVGVILGLGLIAGGAVILGINIDFAVHESPVVTARVVGYSVAQACSSRGGGCSDVYPPKVAFTTATKARVTATVSGLKPDSPAPNGVVMQINYDLVDPSNVRVTDGGSWWGDWVLPSLLVLFGGFMGWACLPTRRQKDS